MDLAEAREIVLGQLRDSEALRKATAQTDTAVDEFCEDICKIIRESLDGKDAEIARLREELIEALTDIVDESCHLHKDGKHSGWIDSMARTSLVGTMDRLVELGRMEKHPTAGHGRVQLYRWLPKEGGSDDE